MTTNLIESKIKIATKLKQATMVAEGAIAPVVIGVVDESGTHEEDSGQFKGKPIMKFETKTGAVLIYRTMKGDGLWVTGETKDHKHLLKNAGGTWNAKMVAWLFNLPAKYILVPYFMDKSLGL